MTVVAGYVPGEVGRRVIAGAAREAEVRNVPLVVVNSATGGAYADRGLAPLTELDALRQDLQARGLQVETRQATEALSAADTLIGAAEETGAELVVIGLRRRSRTGKFLLGSTAQTVLLGSACDVLGIRISTDE
ncbi:universal stress protein [Prauserella alba]|uniref:Universal stress protein n=1 Tax=Prauserella alba TaxID=176898 RepID=A0ABN1VFY5_9PSEU|nr:universal stress protein [Prauserella alba]MCP2183043.1 Universal stress protein family protein [Prauserella alba]